MAGGVARTRGAHHRNALVPRPNILPRQPPLLPGQNRLTCPCQAQNAKSPKLVVEGPRALDARRRRSPDPIPAPLPIVQDVYKQHSRMPRSGIGAIAPIVGLKPCCIAVHVL